MKINRRFIVIFIILVVVGAYGYFTKTDSNSLAIFTTDDYQSGRNLTAVCNAKEYSQVTHIIDGDTIIVEDGYHVRLIGINADEKNQPCYDEASQRLEELVLNKTVLLKKEVSDVDKYGRCLRDIFLEDKNIALELAKEGMVVARSYSPDIMYAGQITDVESEAIKNKVGCKWNK